MGYVKYIKLFLNKICLENDCNNSKMDDQRLVCNMCNSDFFKENVGFDTENKIFLNLLPKNLFTNKTSFKLTNNKVSINNNEPNFVHGPGNTDLNFILETYNYDTKNINTRTNYMTNAIKTYSVYFIPDLIIIIILVIIIIVMIKYIK